MTTMATHFPWSPQMLKEMEVARTVAMMTATSLPIIIEVNNRWGRERRRSMRSPA